MTKDYWLKRYRYLTKDYLMYLVFYGFGRLWVDNYFTLQLQTPRLRLDLELFFGVCLHLLRMVFGALGTYIM